MLPIAAKLSVILKSECLNTLEFLLLLEREQHHTNSHKTTAIKQHHLFCNYSSGFDDFSILASNNNDFKITLMESLLIDRDQPPLNNNRHSLPLELFDD